MGALDRDSPALAAAGAHTPSDGPGGAEEGPRAPLLTDVLFDGRFDDLHRPWTAVLDREIFRYRGGLSATERSGLAYARLRALNDHVDSPEDLVADTARLVSLHEWLGVVDGSLTTLATVHYNLFLGSLLRLDPRGTVDRTPFTRLSRYGAVLITELGFGNNAARLETTATYHHDSDSIVLHTPSPRAQKFMPNTGPAGGAKSGLVAARLLVGGEDRGVFLFLVPLRDERGPAPGVRIRPLSESPGSAVDHAMTSFDQVTLPRTALLGGGHGDITAEGGFHSTVDSRGGRFLASIQRVTAGKLCLSAATLAGARCCLTIAVRYGHRRRTRAPGHGPDVPVFAYRSHHTRLLGALADAYAATFLLREATRAPLDHDAAGPAADAARLLVAAAKGWITWRSRDIAMECRERCGAQGLLSANRVVDLLAAIEGAITAEGDNLVIWQRAAADMLTGRGYTPPSPPGPRTGTATAPTALLDLLVHRELDCLGRARAHLDRPGESPLAQWNHAANPALDLVAAHATRRAAQAFLTAAKRVRHHATRDLLTRVFRLFALRALAPHTGLLLADGRLTAADVHALTPAADRVGADLAPHALTLVEAFALPDTLLQAPIATDRYAAAHDDPAGPWRQPPPGP
ncbi:acyl-CoA dehydrogenase [Streptomyces sp. NPDC050560]|uniref:acyl-CoA dehydrogenase family protein n=1 Tax=Streptomyces sp. NPDC050560 TaxID=3365630 RepID=UPI0037AC32EB